MDAVQQFTSQQGITVPKTFVVAGASKGNDFLIIYWIDYDKN